MPNALGYFPDISTDVLLTAESECVCSWGVWGIARVGCLKQDIPLKFHVLT